MNRTPKTLTAGSTLASRTIGPITQTDIVRFAGAGGDFNPLHHDNDYALRAGLPGVISMGQMQAGMLAGWLTDQVHVEHLLSLAIRFVSPLHIGDVLELRGEVTSVADQGSEATLDLIAAVGDRRVITGTARIRSSR